MGGRYGDTRVARTHGYGVSLLMAPVWHVGAVSAPRTRAGFAEWQLAGRGTLLDDAANRAMFPAPPVWTILLGRGAEIPKPAQGRTLSVLLVDDLLEVISKFDGTVQTLGLGIKAAHTEETLGTPQGAAGWTES